MQTESFYDEILTCTTIISSFNSEKNYTITLDRDQMTPMYSIQTEEENISRLSRLLVDSFRSNADL